MNNTYLNVLIADDEAIVREGLKHIIDWSELGFFICAEAENGEDALQKINKFHPDLVLLDIRMPKMNGTELIEQLRKNGFGGDFIILSGYSDFQYAQTALQYGVSYYLTKPIDEDKLEEAVLAVKMKVEMRLHKESSLHLYLKKAKTSVLFDLIIKPEFDESLHYQEFGLISPIYQVVFYEGYTPFFSSYNFEDLLRVTNNGNDSFEHIVINNHNVILLKGTFALERFNACLTHYENGTEKGSPLDSIFLVYGKPIHRLSDIHASYLGCRTLMERRFFCEENQHFMSYDDLPTSFSEIPFATSANANTYSELLVNYIQTSNRRKISQVLTEMKNAMLICPDDVNSLKHFLADIMIQIKQSIAHSYNHVAIPLSPNALMLESIQSKYYLFEILLYFTEQFEIIMNAIGNHSSDSIFEDILYYINHNYYEPLKLESIAPLFGYNSSYLGKLFMSKTNKSFNAYLDEIRIAHSTKLLAETDLKVYEIASKAGYRNVDYFHQKFKKIVGCSPAEYRKTNNRLF